jgi:hypothetical protein
MVSRVCPLVTSDMRPMRNLRGLLCKFFLFHEFISGCTANAAR